MNNKTITAIATPYGVGAIAVVRLSGDNAITIADKAFKSPNNKKLIDAPTHTIHYGSIINIDTNEEIDEVMVSIMHAPRTFTKENVVEISTHGGLYAPRAVLHELLKAGASLAMPGEFTKRAFLNGRLDLSQAEAVIDIINSQTAIAQKSALSQLDGSLSKRINSIRDTLLDLVAHLQVSIDYPDEDVEELTYTRLLETTKKALTDVNELIKTADDGKIITEGITTAIVGTTNVGKSSLLNAISGENRAIVTDVEGTTRDIVTEKVTIDGVPLMLLDTAGIRSTLDTVEKIGVEKSKEHIELADLVILVLDASRPMNEDDKKVLKITEGKNRIVLINKADLAQTLDTTSIAEMAPDAKIVVASAKTGIGIDELGKAIKEIYNLGNLNQNNMTFITNSRHKQALVGASNALSEAINTLENHLPTDIASIDINIAIDALGEITGASVTEDIVGTIFARFCVGK